MVMRMNTIGIQIAIYRRGPGRTSLVARRLEISRLRIPIRRPGHTPTQQLMKHIARCGNFPELAGLRAAIRNDDPREKFLAADSGISTGTSAGAARDGGRCRDWSGIHRALGWTHAGEGRREGRRS